jgi:hypothetical protein
MLKNPENAGQDIDMQLEILLKRIQFGNTRVIGEKHGKKLMMKPMIKYILKNHLKNVKSGL